MSKRLRSAEPPLRCQRRFEPSRVEQQHWSEAYEQLVSEGRRTQAKRPATVAGPEKREQTVTLISDLLEGQCA
jgi:hypothetical protein